MLYSRSLLVICFTHLFLAAPWSMRNFPDQGLNLFPLQLKLGVLTTGPPGKSQLASILNLLSFNVVISTWFFLSQYFISILITGAQCNCFTLLYIFYFTLYQNAEEICGTKWVKTTAVISPPLIPLGRGYNMPCDSRIPDPHLCK